VSPQCGVGGYNAFDNVLLENGTVNDQFLAPGTHLNQVWGPNETAIEISGLSPQITGGFSIFTVDAGALYAYFTNNVILSGSTDAGFDTSGTSNATGSGGLAGTPWNTIQGALVTALLGNFGQVTTTGTCSLAGSSTGLGCDVYSTAALPSVGLASTDSLLAGVDGFYEAIGATAPKLMVYIAHKGTFTCSAGGTISISDTAVLNTSDIPITLNTLGGTVTTVPAINGLTTGTGFTVLCGGSDTSVYNYAIMP
jgi:hypothetical protein